MATAGTCVGSAEGSWVSECLALRSKLKAIKDEINIRLERLGASTAESDLAVRRELEALKKFFDGH